MRTSWRESLLASNTNYKLFTRIEKRTGEVMEYIYLLVYLFIQILINYSVTFSETKYKIREVLEFS